jgi:hydroxymethylglutaryl-CoA lyase
VAASVGVDQDMRIEQVFDERMESGSESEFGLRDFQSGNRNIDWDAYMDQKGRPKL